jgi:hypothetical protein
MTFAYDNSEPPNKLWSSSFFWFPSLTATPISTTHGEFKGMHDVAWNTVSVELQPALEDLHQHFLTFAALPLFHEEARAAEALAEQDAAVAALEWILSDDDTKAIHRKFEYVSEEFTTQD